MAIYAPSPSVSISNNVDLVGAVAAKKFEIGNNSSVTYDGRVERHHGDGLGASCTRTRAWQECTNDPSGLALDSGC